MNLLVFFLICLAGGCGGDVPQVWLEISEDLTDPCLGAAHMKVKVNVGGEEIRYDEFGIFFKTDTYDCFINQYSFSDLPLGRGVNVDFMLYDSSNDELGLLTQGRSIDFDVSASSVTKVLRIDLTRRPGIQKGTVVISEPTSWGQVEGVVILQFRVLLASDSTYVRSGYIASYDALDRVRKEPFPLIVSNLPTPDILTDFYVQVDGLDRDKQILTSWSGTAWLGTGLNTIAYVKPE